MSRGAPLSGGSRELILGGVALGVLLALGTLGYMALEGWSVMDALYMTFITLTTIGFGEVQPLHPVGKLFTIALATVGIGTFATIATRAVQYVVTNSTFRERVMQRRIDALTGHYVVCGYGRLGQRITRDLQQANLDVVVVDRRDDRAEQLTEAGILFVQDEAQEEETLRTAGLLRAAGLVLVLPNDADNVFVALSAREMRPDDGLFIVARTNEHASIRKFLRAGADKVISPLDVGADRIAQTILRPQVDRFMDQVLGVNALDFDLEEARIEAGSDLEGKSLADVDFRRRFNAIVVAVFNASDAQWLFNPDALVPLRAGDTLIVLGSPEAVRTIRAQGEGTDVERLKFDV